MSADSALRTKARRIAPWLIALALTLRLFSPPGWMPANGHVAIMPCDGLAMTPAAHAQAMPGMAGHGAPAAPSHRQQPCEFAQAAPLFDGGGGASPLAAPDGLPEPAAVPALSVHAVRRIAAPPPPATGPPRLA